MTAMRRLSAATSATERLWVNLILVLVISVPVYGGYTRIVQSRLGFAEHSTTIHKREVMIYFSTFGKWPVDGGQMQRPVSQDQTGETRTEHGAVTFRFADTGMPGLKGKSLTFRPSTVAAEPPSVVVWQCGDSTRWPRFAPQGKDHTDISSNYLVYQCF